MTRHIIPSGNGSLYFTRAMMVLAFPISLAGLFVEGESGQIFSYIFMAFLCIGMGYLYLRKQRRTSLLLTVMFFIEICIRTGFSIALHGNLQNMTSVQYILMVTAVLVVVIPVSVYVVITNYPDLRKWFIYFFTGKWG
ncbi:MAG: hypothetical protein ACYCYO_18255 [Bacilli bacterium]